jgi:hypothetical protein
LRYNWHEKGSAFWPLARLNEYFEKNLSESRTKDEYAVFAVFNALNRSYK